MSQSQPDPRLNERRDAQAKARADDHVQAASRDRVEVPSALRRTFADLGQALQASHRPDEFLCAWVQAEASDYVRLNQGRLRQAGSVHRQQATLRLIQGARQSSLTITLSDDPGRSMAEQIRPALESLRAVLIDSEDDPLLDVCRDAVVSEDVGPGLSSSGRASGSVAAVLAQETGVPAQGGLDPLIDVLSVCDVPGERVAFIPAGPSDLCSFHRRVERSSV